MVYIPTFGCGTWLTLLLNFLKPHLVGNHDVPVSEKNSTRYMMIHGTEKHKWCVYVNVNVYIYIPGTQMSLVLVGKDLVFGGWPSKIEVIWVPGTYICRWSERQKLSFKNFWEPATFKSQVQLSSTFGFCFPVSPSLHGLWLDMFSRPLKGWCAEPMVWAKKASKKWEGISRKIAPQTLRFNSKGPCKVTETRPEAGSSSNHHLSRAMLNFRGVEKI